jgi:membrane-bound lytic murein transglycosylase D
VADTVPIDYSVDMRLVADVVDADPQEIMALNPSLLRFSTPPSGVLSAPFDLHLPPGTATLYQQRIAEIPVDKRVQWRYHRVTPDDSLASVARSYHVSVDQLVAVNQLHSGDTLGDIEALVIPVPLPSAPAAHVETYKARRGDTLVTIADRFGVSLDELHRWNHSTGTAVTAGQRIRIAESIHLASNPRTHSASRETRSAPAKAEAGKKTESAATKRPSSKAASASNAKSRSAQSEHKPSVSKETKVHSKSTSKKNMQK